MKHFFTADDHCGHSNILKYCARTEWMTPEERALLVLWQADARKNFEVSRASTDKMDDALIDNINKIVGPDDILWYLGDFCFAPEWKAIQYRSCINCKTIHLIWGNHDSRDFARASLFTTANDLASICIAEDGRYWFWKSPKNTPTKKFVLCHTMMAIWPGSHKNAVHLYGHSHATAEEWANSKMPGRRSMDVGVDNAFRLFGEYRPFSLDEIINLLPAETTLQIDHHEPPAAKFEPPPIELPPIELPPIELPPNYFVQPADPADEF